MKHRFILQFEKTPQETLDAYRTIGECLNADKDSKWEVIIRPYKATKSQEQRNYWHKCISVLAKHCGYSLPEMKSIIKEEILGKIEFTDRKGKTRYREYSTEDLNKEQYSKLIDNTWEIAIGMGIALPHPDDRGRDV